jgi:hypothetical protein
MLLTETSAAKKIYNKSFKTQRGLPAGPFKISLIQPAL